MRVHFSNTGLTRVGLSERNIERLLAKYELAGARVPLLQSGDCYEDDEAIPGLLQCGVGDDDHHFVVLRGQQTAPLVVLYCHRSWLEQALQELATHEQFYTLVSKQLELYAERDHLHYQDREPGI